MDKNSLIGNIQKLTVDIRELSSLGSLATLDHKLNERQKLLVNLFDSFQGDLNKDDLSFLKTIQEETSKLLGKMESEKIDKGDELIKHKTKGNRIRLYTNIAKQK